MWCGGSDESVKESMEAMPYADMAAGGSSVSVAFLFPGQGSQAIGMGQELAAASTAARLVFEEVNDALGQDLSGLIWHGSLDELTMTENAQPALMATSIAALQAMREHGAAIDHVQLVAGHSLGEYSALCAAGALALADTAQLLRARGRAMQNAVPVGQGAMAALLGIDAAAAQELAELAAGGQVCQVANDNEPAQIVISGHLEAIDRALELAQSRNIRKSVKLPVSAPFHCALMEPAARVMEERLSDIAIREPDCPLVANVTAEPVTDPDQIRSLLVQQVAGRVRWRESMLTMVDFGITGCIEIGGANTLSRMARRISKDLKCLNVGQPADLDRAAEFMENAG